MKRSFASAIILTLAAGAAVWAAQDAPKESESAAANAEHMPDMPGPSEGHAWLQRLVGEWTFESEMMTGPDQPPMKAEGTESIRSLGGFWVISNFKSEIMGESFEASFTLGYDPQKQKYIGTWVDSMTSHMWIYEGSLDETKKILTLNTTGPSPEGDSGKFREVIELKSDDHRVFTSSMQNPDGTWVTFVTMHAHRKK